MNTTKSKVDRDHAPSISPVSAAALATEMTVFDSEKLFGSSNEIGILHEGALYRLKITRQGKLILNK